MNTQNYDEKGGHKQTKTADSDKKKKRGRVACQGCVGFRGTGLRAEERPPVCFNADEN